MKNTYLVVLPVRSVVATNAVSGDATMKNPRVRYDRRYRVFRVSSATRASVSVALWKKQSMPADELANHVSSTYASVRYGMAAIAVAFPLVLFLGGHLEGVELQRSLSAYYWQAPFEN
jgi:hypothetical protein